MEIRKGRRALFVCWFTLLFAVFFPSFPFRLLLPYCLELSRSSLLAFSAWFSLLMKGSTPDILFPTRASTSCLFLVFDICSDSRRKFIMFCSHFFFFFMLCFLFWPNYFLCIIVTKRGLDCCVVRC